MKIMFRTSAKTIAQCFSENLMSHLQPSIKFRKELGEKWEVKKWKMTMQNIANRTRKAFLVKATLMYKGGGYEMSFVFTTPIMNTFVRRVKATVTTMWQFSRVVVFPPYESFDAHELLYKRNVWSLKCVANILRRKNFQYLLNNSRIQRIIF
jgi:hypothetical protein